MKGLSKALVLIIAAPALLFALGIVFVWGSILLHLYWPGNAKVAQEGTVIAQSIYQFKADRGIWPQYLKDLVPECIEREPDEHWHYSESAGNPDLVYFGPRAAAYVYYNFDPNENVWKAGGREASRRIWVKQKKPAGPRVPLKSIEDNRVNELMRRTEREPNEILHYQRLISFFVKERRFDEAVSVCRNGIEEIPESWWLRVAKAIALSEKVGNRKAGEEVSRWVDENPSFLNYYYVAYYWRRQNEYSELLKALREAAKYPIVTDKFSRYVHWYYGKSAAYYAYEQGDYNLAIALCERTEQLDYCKNSADAVRAAALLGLGQFEQAEWYAQRALEVESNYAGWKDISNFRSLLAAAQENNSKFVFEYDKDDVGEPLDFFVDY